jgi:hypothetical protein
MIFARDWIPEPYGLVQYDGLVNTFFGTASPLTTLYWILAILLILVMEKRGLASEGAGHAG